MNKGAVLPLVMGVAVGGLAIKLGLDTIKKAKAGGNADAVTVVVATVDIPSTARIEKRVVREITTVAGPLVGNDSFTSVDDVVSRVTGSFIPRGSVVREALLAPEGTPPGLSVKIPAGYRAVSVKIDEVTGVAYQLRPGSFVDVIAVMDVKGGRNRETISRIILQRIKVAAVGQVVGEEEADSGRVAKSVTLLVKSIDVPKLHLAQTRGKVTLAMRSADDTAESSSGETRESDLLSSVVGGLLNKAFPSTPVKAPPKKVAPPVTPPPKLHVVEVVNGLGDRKFVTYGGGGSTTKNDQRQSQPGGSQATNSGRDPDDDGGKNE